MGAPPLITEVSRPWWDALAREEIAVQRCARCSTWVFYPRPFCTSCGARELTWITVDPGATLYTWSVAEVPVSPLFAHLSKPILAIVELSVGVRVPSTLVGVERDSVQIGMPLNPVFDHDTYPGVTLLRFGLVPASS